MMKALVVAACALGLGAEPVRFEVNRESSFVAMKTGKSGFLTVFGAGHRHGIVATDWSADICADSASLSGASVSVVIPTAALQIDTPRARQLAGLSPNDGPNAKTVSELQRKMLGDKYLAASAHPEIRFRSTSVVQRQGTSLVLEGELTMRGRAESIRVPVRVQRTGQEFLFRGEFRVKQSSFGIHPESVGGVVNVEDEVDILFHFAASPGATACRR